MEWSIKQDVKIGGEKALVTDEHMDCNQQQQELCHQSP